MNDWFNKNTKIISTSEDVIKKNAIDSGDIDKLNAIEVKTEENKKLNTIINNKNFDFEKISEEDYNLLIKDENWKKFNYENSIKFKDYITNKSDISNTDLIKKIENTISEKHNQEKIVNGIKIQKEFKQREKTFNTEDLSSENITKKIKDLIDNQKTNDAIFFFESNYTRLNKDDLNSMEQLFTEKNIKDFNEKIEKQREHLIKNEKAVISMDKDQINKVQEDYKKYFKGDVINILGTSIEGLQEIANSNLMEFNIKQLEKEQKKFEDDMEKMLEELKNLEGSEKEKIDEFIKNIKENEDKAKTEKNEAYKKLEEIKKFKLNLIKEMEEIQLKKEKLENEIKTKETEIENKKKEFETMNQGLEEIINQIKNSDQLKDFGSDIEKDNFNIELINTKNLEINKALKKKEIEKNELNEKLNKFNNQQEELKTNIEINENELNEKTKKLESLDLKINKIEEFKTKISPKIESLKKLKNKNINILNENENIKSEIENLEKQNSENLHSITLIQNENKQKIEIEIKEFNLQLENEEKQKFLTLENNIKNTSTKIKENVEKTKDEKTQILIILERALNLAKLCCDKYSFMNKSAKDCGNEMKNDIEKNNLQFQQNQNIIEVQ